MTTFEAGATILISACKLSDNKVAVIYNDAATDIKIIAGTITGKTVVWGLAQVVETVNSTSSPDIAQLATDKIAIVYVDASDDGNCKIATVSGTVFTIGDAVKWQGTDNVQYTSVCKIDTDKILVAYYDSTNTQGEAVAATISGTVPDFGTPVVYDTDVVVRTSCCQLDTDKALIVYGETTNSNGEARVATVSAKVVAFDGAVAEFDSAALAVQPSCAQLTTDKAIVTWTRANDIYCAGATVSGSTITFGAVDTGPRNSGEAAAAGSAIRSCVAFSATQAVMSYTSTASTFYSIINIASNVATFEPQVDTGNGDSGYTGLVAFDADRFVMVWDDDDDSDKGKAFVSAIKGNEDLYVGITTGAITAAASGTVQKEGVLAGFSGLTAGTAYYGADAAVSSTKSELYLGVAKDTDEIDLSHGDPTKMSTGNKRFARLQISRAAADASGDEILDFGFEPKMVMFYAYGNAGTVSNAKSIGSWVNNGTFTDQGCVTTTGAGVDSADTANVIEIDKDGTDKQTATISATSGTTITLAWTKGTNGEAGSVEVVAYA